MKIEKNVPITKPRHNHRRKYPFNEMVPGDSMFFPGQGPKGPALSAFKTHCTRWGWKASQRTTEDGIRIWRRA